MPKFNLKMEMNNKQFRTDSREKENIRGKDCNSEEINKK